MKHVDLYTDGACSGNPGPGGYGIILVYNGKEKELSEGFAETTNNRMEILAVINGLKALKEPCEVTVYSDSKYVVDAVNKNWLYNWEENDWRRSNKEPVLNPELWMELLVLMEEHEVSFVWVKGHNEHPQNERCDRLAVAAAQKAKKELEN